MKKVLIFTEQKVGEGHYQAAIALKKLMNQVYRGRVQTKVFPGLRTVHPILESVIIAIYFIMIRYAPFLWKLMYKRAKKSTFFQRILFAYKLKGVIDTEKPDLIICTHATCVPALCELKKKGAHHFQLGAVFTDYGFHPYFVHSLVDFFFVAHHRVKEQLIRQHLIPENKIFDFGIPIDPSFEEDERHPKVIPLKDKKRFHVLILGGAMGIGPIQKLVRMIQKRTIPCELMIITGRNQALFNKLKKKQSSNITVLGYVQDMKYWLKKADIVLTKPGGLTVSEAIACGTPLMTIKPIPGHEEMNQRFIQEESLGIHVRHIRDVPYYLQFYLYHPEELEKLRQQIRSFQRQKVAYQIVTTLFEKGLSTSLSKQI